MLKLEKAHGHRHQEFIRRDQPSISQILGQITSQTRPCLSAAESESDNQALDHCLSLRVFWRSHDQSVYWIMESISVIFNRQWLNVYSTKGPGLDLPTARQRQAMEDFLSRCWCWQNLDRWETVV